ncbi:hypothetical protein GCM10023191_026770 [Actinoallomurus oryzae]|uniref:Hint domain-containing protein n=1 Tax=Actinoallomurus oryzae TaxID=502180 RepID=A0ABP8PT85_9ACTN
MLSRRGLLTWIRFPAAFILAVCLPASALAAPGARPTPVRQALPQDPKCTAQADPAVPAASKGQAPAPRRFVAALTRPGAAAKVSAKADATTGAYAAPDTPQRMVPGETYTVKVTLTNVTDTAWTAADQALSYHWTLPDGTDISDSSNQQRTALPGDIAPHASATVEAKVTAPSKPSADSRRALTLKWDLYDSPDRSWLSRTANVATLDQQITVDEPTSGQLGLESFYQYSGIPAGAGSSLVVNQSSGNAVFGYNAFANPSRGLATFVRLTYNSRDTSNSYAGYGWSVATSTLSRLGTPLRFDGLAAPGWPQRVTYTDGDGTDHTFTLDRHDSGDTSTWSYYSPAGVHLYLRKVDGGWSMTSPDRTQALFDGNGYQTATVDKNGNRMTFEYQPAVIGGHSVEALTDIVDATGRRTLTFDYAQPGDRVTVFHGKAEKTLDHLADADVVGRLLSMTDIAGRKITFTYGDDGLLRQITDGAGGDQPKNFAFVYDQGRLTKVTDPVGHSSTLTYGDGERLTQLTDRRGKPTGFSYGAPDHGNGDQTTSTVTDANGHATRYVIDAYGRPTRMTDAKSENTQLSWDADNNVVKMVEDNGATTTWRYDPKTGYPLEIRDAEANRHDYPGTVLAYNTGLDGHIADLVGKTSSEGRKWVFGYDDHGNLISVTDPKGSDDPTEGDYTTRYTYDGYGQLVTVTDANGHSTKYGDYDPSGYPRTTTDPFGCRTVNQYDVTGNVVLVTDANNHTGTYSYDLFKRPLSSRVPKDAAKNQYIVTPGPRYDANDNVLQSTAPNGAVTTTHYDADDNVVAVTAPKDSLNGPNRTGTFTYDAVGNVLRSTEPDGTLTSDPDDYTTTFTYDALDRVVASTDAAGHRTTTDYDDVGNTTKTVDPRKNATPDPNDFTAKYTYDLNHQPISVTDATGHTKTTGYDHDGLRVSSTDEDGNKTLYTLDERGAVTQVKVPHAKSGDSITYDVTKYTYDQVGNQTSEISPRGVASGRDDAFTTQTVYDALNRVKTQKSAYDPKDTQYDKPAETYYGYDKVGNLAEVSAPPSSGQTLRNVTGYTYYDNGWTKTSTDPWSIQTSYDYNELGLQTSRTITSAGGSSSRTMGWDYYPDGKIKARNDDGVPVGKAVALVDDSDTQNVAAVGNWPASDDGTGYQGYDYQTHAADGSADSFTWNPTIPEDGTYEVFVSYPEVAGAATDASYTITHDGATSKKTVDQTKNTGTWVSLGSYSFSRDGDGQKVGLAAGGGGTVVADAVKLVRDNSGDTDNEKTAFTYTYDANGTLTDLTDDSPGARVDDYAATYDGVGRLITLKEKKSGSVVGTTAFTYDADGNTVSTTRGDRVSTFEYDTRDLLAKVTAKQSADDASPKVTTFTWTPGGQVDTETKANGNKVTSSYFLDGALQHQEETKPDGTTTVAEHTYTYDPNGNQTKDVSRTQNADDHSSYLNRTTDTSYTPRDQVAEVTKTGGGTSESYTYDDNGNVISQKSGGSTTTSKYDRDRLQSTTVGGISSSYDYDPFGRLDSITTAGNTVQRYTYDGFDHIASERKKSGNGFVTTDIAYDPFDRTVSKTENAGTGNAKTTVFDYLATSNAVVDEKVDGKVTKSYDYSPWGERLSQIVHKSDGSQEPTYYTYNSHSDVQAVTDANGDTKSTYGYTAYGADDSSQDTGADKPGSGSSTEPYNAYRYNADRVDGSTGTYDMGFRTYDPGLNRFLTRDLYNGALDDLALVSNPFTGNRYAFGGGNPFSNIEIDGHGWLSDLGHAALDVAGMIPVVGAVADVANGAWYAAEGDYLDAGLSFAGAIPVIGDAALGARYAIKGAKYAEEGVEAARAVKNGVHAAEDVKAGAKAVEAGGDAVKGGRTAAKGTTAAEDAQRAAAARKLAAERAAAEREARAEAAAAEKAEAEGAEQAEKAAQKATCPIPNSFTPDTRVLMGDGTTKPIKDVKVGDHVQSTDPATGKTTSRTVTGLITTTGTKHLVDITVGTTTRSSIGAKAQGRDRAVSVGQGGHLVATDHHPFWVADQHRWLDAGQLRPGMWLRTSSGTYVQISAVRQFTRFFQSVNNLSVETSHDYYVEAGNTPVLVHNTAPVPPPAGVVYLRTDLSTGEEYVGQAKSWTRYLERQTEHARDFPHTTFDFDVLGRANPGTDLDVLEESWIRAGGGKASVPGSVLTNKRVQMSDKRYKAAGGTVC